MKRILLLAIVILSVSVFATSVSYDPQGLMFMSRPGASINVNVSLNKGMGSTYYGGESLGLSFSVDRSAYVAVLDIDPSGQIQVLFPNVYDQDNYVQGGKTYTLPTDKATTKYNLQIQSQRGRETIVVVASSSPLNFLGNVFSLFDRYPFPYLSQNINNLSVVIDPIFSTSWGMGYTYFYNSYVPFTVRTTIRADRNDANVYVDGIFMGKSPVTTTLETGTHTVYLYTDRNLVYGPSTINVQPGSSDFQFSLLPNYIYGYLEVTSIPDGQVYVDGQYAGDTPYRDFEKVGSHTVTVSKWGYHDAKQNVYINRDMATSVDLRLTEKTEEEKKTDNIILFSIIGVLIAGIVIAIVLGASN
ncbi:MAG: DUF4384 domain-containing protein [Kosmotogaceae bacterium]|nr:DUF4384 domain-containing protein [Kosmotogaceae bacterium]